jgi:hypothetical protein
LEKLVVGVSIGSSRRDHRVEVELGGDSFIVERRGTDGDLAAAEALIRELDGKAAAIGLGGLDVFVYAGGRRYALRDGLRLMRAAVRTPVVDGSGLKNTLERETISTLDQGILPWAGRRVLMVLSVDRFGMAEALVEAGAKVTFGDLPFGLGVPIPLHSLAAVSTLARVLMPVVSNLPIGWLYPTGKSQEKRSPDDWRCRYLKDAEVIAGDFHYIARYLPRDVTGKIFVTNTTTAADVDELKSRGAAALITTTPRFGGRSFGTNVMEALLVARAGAHGELPAAEYRTALHDLGFQPEVTFFGPGGAPAANPGTRPAAVPR